MITVVDYGMGNLRSLVNAFEFIGVPVELQSTPQSIMSATKLIIPGVGAFGDAMRNLHERNLVQALNEVVLQRKVPVLGICLGMQLMADSSEEHGKHQGLGWIPGSVVKLSPSDPMLKVPHVGWNDIKLSENPHPIFNTLNYETHLTFYFVHSFHLKCSKDSDMLASCSHGQEFSAAVGHANIIATQFHPEKSQDNGLQMLRNFTEWDGC
jgi:glutamine amidotransferase